MPPQIALLLCTMFVLFLLFLERRGARNVSAAVWIPTVWMLIAASRSLGSWFVGPAQAGGGNESGSPLDRWVLTALAVAAILVLVHRRFDWWGAIRQHKWLLVVLAYMFLSTFWSEITLIALKRWMREVIVLSMALLIMSETNPRQSLASLLRRCAYVLLPFSVVLIKYYPELGRQYGKYSGIEMWTGVTTQKNQLGRLCMISIFFLLLSLYRRWRKEAAKEGGSPVWADISVMVIAVYLLIGARSSTSIGTLFAGAAILLALSLFHKLKLRMPKAATLALAIFLICFGTLAPFLGGSNVAVFSSSLGRDDTLTGRTEVWAAVLPAMKQQPLFGYGFGSFWTDARRERYDIPTAHNGYLDILLEQGEVGLAFYTLWVISCARKFSRAFSQDYEWASLAICFLFMNLVYNNTESALNSLAEYMTAMLVFASSVVPTKIAALSNAALPIRMTFSSRLRQLHDGASTQSR